MDYYNYQIKTELPEVLMAFLNELSFDTFEETDEGIDAWIPVKALTTDIETEIKQLQGQFNFTWKRELVKHQNWNKVWESNFSPVVVGKFCAIRADFHEPIEEVQYEIVINPKMAFGTGHHETTFMMMSKMETLDFKDKKILDYGCGTGILAILADMLGATDIEAIDIEEESYLNTLENAERNGATHIKTFHGTLPDIQNKNFDIILANINRNVILESLSSLYDKLKSDGLLIVSGFLQQDEHLLVTQSKAVGFQTGRRLQKGKWICQTLEKNIE